MPIFKSKTLLDKAYEIGILIKGIDGLLELLAGVFLLVVSSGTILHITDSLTRNELVESPHNFVAVHLAKYGHHLANGHSVFTVIFLLTHGFVKVGLVVCLLLNKLWAYPLGIGALSLLLLYQLYQLVVSPSFGMAFLTVLDIVIIWLVWREWRHVKTIARKQSA